MPSRSPQQLETLLSRLEQFMASAYANPTLRPALLSATYNVGAGSEAATMFTDLADCPGSYAGQAGKLLQINEAENALTFGAAASGGSVDDDSIWDAKGDLAVGTGPNAAARLAVGANDTVLMADSGQVTGLKWSPPAEPGSLAFGDSPAGGTADTWARSDHVHGMPADPAPPAGAIVAWPTSSAPSGWLLCDGAAVDRTTYAALFAVIGATYGAGDGSTTFNLPDLRGRVIVGLDAGQSEFDALGEAGGAKAHTLTESEMPAHTHVQDSHNHTQDAHNHIQDAHRHQTLTERSSTTGSATTLIARTSDTSSTVNTGVNTEYATPTNQPATATNQAATATNQDAGGGDPHNNLQPYLVLNWVIKG